MIAFLNRETRLQSTKVFRFQQQKSGCLARPMRYFGVHFFHVFVCSYSLIRSNWTWLLSRIPILHPATGCFLIHFCWGGGSDSCSRLFYHFRVYLGSYCCDAIQHSIPLPRYLEYPTGGCTCFRLQLLLRLIVLNCARSIAYFALMVPFPVLAVAAAPQSRM
jgi:hypothetical protein